VSGLLFAHVGGFPVEETLALFTPPLLLALRVSISASLARRIGSSATARRTTGQQDSATAGTACTNGP
jgi:hypothetical protein